MLRKERGENGARWLEGRQRDISMRDVKIAPLAAQTGQPQTGC